MWGINSGSGSSSRSIFGLYFLDLNLGSTPSPQPYVSSKLNVLFSNSVPSGQNWKFFHKEGSFFQTFIWSTYNPMLFSNWMFCTITLFQVVRLEKFIHKQGSFFEMTILSTKNPMLSSNWTFDPIFLFISIVCALSLHKPYFYFSSAFFIALNDNLELTVFM